MSEISVNVDGLLDYLDRLDDFLDGDRLTLLLEQVGNLLVQQTLQRFSSETDPDGLAWARRGPPDPRPNQRTLEETGRLRNSFRGGEGGVSVEGREVNIGTNVPYAKFHRTNTNARNLPVREFLGIGLEDERQIRQLIEDFLRDQELVC